MAENGKQSSPDIRSPLLGGDTVPLHEHMLVGQALAVIQITTSVGVD